VLLLVVVLLVLVLVLLRGTPLLRARALPLLCCSGHAHGVCCSGLTQGLHVLEGGELGDGCRCDCLRRLQLLPEDLGCRPALVLLLLVLVLLVLVLLVVLLLVLLLLVLLPLCV
jgi:hypothetical protein